MDTRVKPAYDEDIPVHAVWYSQANAMSPGGNQLDDAADSRRGGLRPASGRPPPHQPAAVSQRLLARSGDDARHDRPGVAILSAKFPDHGAARLAAVARQAGFQPG